MADGSQSQVVYSELGVTILGARGGLGDGEQGHVGNMLEIMALAHGRACGDVWRRISGLWALGDSIKCIEYRAKHLAGRGIAECCLVAHLIELELWQRGERIYSLLNNGLLGICVWLPVAHACDSQHGSVIVRGRTRGRISLVS